MKKIWIGLLFAASLWAQTLSDVPQTIVINYNMARIAWMNSIGLPFVPIPQIQAFIGGATGSGVVAYIMTATYIDSDGVNRQTTSQPCLAAAPYSPTDTWTVTMCQMYADANSNLVLSIQPLVATPAPISIAVPNLP
jgi:hypothetical protein